MDASKKISPEVEGPGIDKEDLMQLAQLAADRFAAAFKGIVSVDAVCDHDSDDLSIRVDSTTDAKGGQAAPV